MKPVKSGRALLAVLLLCIWASGLADPRFPALDNLKPRASPTEQQTAVKDLMKRVIGDRSDVIDVVIKPNMGKDGGDAFHLETVGGRLQISGTTGVAASMGFYYLLKELCGCQYTWAGQQLKLPASLPSLPSPGISVQVLDRFRYFQNVCTVSYAFSWYNASDWEKMIDWMALQGINLPLAFTGQEAIFQKVFLSLGFSQEDLNEFFGGPAFLAWARMGNIKGWGGPLPQSWIDGQKEIQKAVLQRMRSLGIIPVLPAFAGFVPASITKLYPKANVTRSSDWSGFPEQYSEVYLLDFQDPLFKKIGTAFLTEMEKEYGLDHVYSADTFNEMTPASKDPSYLAAAGRAVYEPMKEVDPKAVWLMQGWIFKTTSFWGPEQMKGLLTAVPPGQMLILDLEAEVAPVYTRAGSFFGQPFIWCMLHDFGGNLALYGQLDAVNGGPAQGRAFANSTMVGLGITAEGIFQNEVVFELLLEQSWRPGAANLTDWISKFAVQRYGLQDANIDKAWHILKDSVYNAPTWTRDINFAPVSNRPQLSAYQAPCFKPADQFQAWELLLQASSGMHDNVLFKYDLVDLTRDSLQTLGYLTHQNLSIAFSNKSFAEVVVLGRQMLDILDDMETLLASDSHFLLGPWLESARALGHTAYEKDLIEFNARNRLTLWGPYANILDYSTRQWAGLFKDYFKPRWQLFISRLLEALADNKPFDENAFDTEVFEKIEAPFTFAGDKYPTTTTGNSSTIASQLFEKYSPIVQSYMNSDKSFEPQPLIKSYPSSIIERYKMLKYAL